MSENTSVRSIKKPQKIVKGFTIKQFVAFWFGIVLVIGGISLLILGLIGDYAHIANNPLKSANQTLASMSGFGLTLTWLGVATILFASIVIAFALCLSARNADREKEKEARRQERLEAMKKQREDMVIDVDTSSSTINNR